MNWSSTAQHAIQTKGAMQKQRELATLLALLDRHDQRHPIHNVLEIGGMHGGTMWCWDHIRTNDGKAVVVDKFVLEGRMQHRPDHNFTLINADSTDPQTVSRVLGEFPDRPVDFLFIDGDHSYDAVMKDAENWLPLLASTGIVAFHDICHRWMPDHDMWRFWSNLKVGWPQYCEIYDSSDSWGGIGVIFGSEAGEAPYLRIPEPPIQTIPPECLRCNLPLRPGEDIVCVSCA